MTLSKPRIEASWIVVVLVAAPLAVYAQVGGFDFVNLDDPKYVVENDRVLAGPTREGIVWALTSYEWANWHPLTWISLMIDAGLGGPGPRVYHLHNLLLHLANVLLLFWLLVAVTGERLRSGFVAALFAIHPLHVESVAWITERKDVLSTLFWLLTMRAWVGYARRPGMPRYGLVMAAFALGLMSKPMLVTLPLVLLLFDYWPLRRWGADPPISARGARLVLEKAPLFAMSAVSAAITLQAQHLGRAVQSLEALPLGSRLSNAAVSYLSYIGDMLWPAGLAALYPYPRAGLPVWQVAVSLLLLVGLTAASLALARRRPYVAVGWLWYLTALLPVIGLVQVGVQARADRYTYVPLIGLYILVAWGAGDLARRMSPEGALRRALVTAAAVSALVALAVRAHDQAGHWSDSVSLYRHTLRVTGDNARAHNGLGMALDEEGDPPGALREFREAVRIDPIYADARANLAAALALQGATDEALVHYGEALRLEPHNGGWRADLATVLMGRGATERAIAEFGEAIRIDPDNASAHKNLGVIRARRSEWPEAIAHFREALRIDPRDEGARRNLERAERLQSGP